MAYTPPQACAAAVRAWGEGSSPAASSSVNTEVTAWGSGGTVSGARAPAGASPSVTLMASMSSPLPPHLPGSPLSAQHANSLNTRAPKSRRAAEGEHMAV